MNVQFLKYIVSDVNLKDLAAGKLQNGKTELTQRVLRDVVFYHLHWVALLVFWDVDTL